MNKATVAQSVSPLHQFRLCWHLHLDVSLILVPSSLVPHYFADVALFSGSSRPGGRGTDKIQAGPWNLKLVEWCIESPYDGDPVDFMKDLNATLYQTCIPQVKTTYLRIGEPRSLRIVGMIFFGNLYHMGTSVLIPSRTRPSVELRTTMEG